MASELGRQLAAERRAAGLSQRQPALGVSRRMAEYPERDQRRPRRSVKLPRQAP